MYVTRQQLQDALDSLLKPQAFADYCPNGLQVEGAERIECAAFAVSATAESVARAVAGGAQALVVHHGLFWKFHGARPVVGPFARRLAPLLQHGVNLFGYHLPLDAHPEMGNAAVLGRMIGLGEQQPFGDYQGNPTGVKGMLAEPCSAAALQARLRQVLAHEVLLSSPEPQAAVRSLGIITGGARSEWQLALREGLDAYLTGEMSEHDWHEAQETGMHAFAGGHHATERFGIQALMAHVQQTFALDCFYIDSANPA